MDNNYFIKKNYKINKFIETIETSDKIYWNNERLSQTYYNQYFIYKYCRRLIKKKHLNSILDIGCGPAIKLMKLIYPKCKYIYGIDQEKIIRFSKKKYGLNTFFVDNIENSNLTLEKKFDLIICSDVIEHLLNPDNLIHYIKRFSHKNTYIVISTPERDILRGKNCDFCPKKEHIREWNTQEFNNYLNNHNFRILHHLNVQSFKLFLSSNKPLNEIKRDLITQLFKINKYNSLKKIKGTQLVVCQLKYSTKLSKNLLKELDPNRRLSFLNDLFNFILIKVYILLFNLYKLYQMVKK